MLSDETTENLAAVLESGRWSGAASTVRRLWSDGHIRHMTDIYDGAIHLMLELVGDDEEHAYVRDVVSGNLVCSDRELYLKRPKQKKGRKRTPRRQLMTVRNFRANDEQVSRFERVWGKGWRVSMRDFADAHCRNVLGEVES